MYGSQYSVNGLYQHESHQDDANDGMRVRGNLTSPLSNRKDHDEASNGQQHCCDLRCEGGSEEGSKLKDTGYTI